MLDLTVPEIKRKLRDADAASFAVLERSLVADTRKGVRDAIDVARRRLERQAAEDQRLDGLYSYEQQLADQYQAHIIVGLDEVGRGPLAGPLAVGAVVLDPSRRIQGLNDSKQVKPEAREAIAAEVEQAALAWTVQYVEPDQLDRDGMTKSLIAAFRAAVSSIEAAGITPDLVLLDGNPLHFDQRELSIVKGDARCASIAAASIVAKVARDRLMQGYDQVYPGYAFDRNKGYASAEHIEAIKRLGLSPIHRVSFCSAFTQPTLF